MTTNLGPSVEKEAQYKEPAVSGLIQFGTWPTLVRGTCEYLFWPRPGMLACWFVGCLVGWQLVAWLAGGWLAGWLVGWLAGCWLADSGLVQLPGVGLGHGSGRLSVRPRWVLF